MSDTSWSGYPPQPCPSVAVSGDGKIVNVGLLREWLRGQSPATMQTLRLWGSHQMMKNGLASSELADMPADWIWFLAARLQTMVNDATAQAAACMRTPSIQIPAAALNQWQPIETAPKDGTHILGSSVYGGQWENEGRFCVVVQWDAKVVWGDPEEPDKLGGWVSNANDGQGRKECDCMPDCCCGDAGIYCGITHWMPLPPQEMLPGGAK